MHFVSFLESSQDCNGVLDRWLANEHLLKAPLKSSVLLYILAIFIKCCGTNHPQLAASKHRLNHVARINRALCSASTNQRVNFINKRNDLAICVSDFFEHCFQPLFKLATIFRTSQH